MKELKFGRSVVSSEGPAYVIAEIGHNHQGNLKVAIDMVKIAAQAGANAVKFQKRNNKKLYTKAMYNKPYDNEDSFGLTYGEHREFLEFERDEYKALKKCADDNNVEFMCTAFDEDSADFLEELGVASYKLASGDLTNIPLIKYVAKLNKPIFLSTGAATLDEVRLAYETVLKYHNKLCLLHTTCTYPTDYSDLHMRVIQTLKKEFPEALIGYSGHDNGILAAILAYMLGATVIEKHFTINHAWKGTDHKFSLEPEGLRKQVRDLSRLLEALGEPQKIVRDIEAGAKAKMGKSIYTSRPMSAGERITADSVCMKSPAGGMQPYQLDAVIGKILNVNLPEEALILPDHLHNEQPKKDKKSAHKVS